MQTIIQHNLCFCCTYVFDDCTRVSYYFYRNIHVPISERSTAEKHGTIKHHRIATAVSINVLIDFLEKFYKKGFVASQCIHVYWIRSKFTIVFSLLAFTSSIISSYPSNESRKYPKLLKRLFAKDLLHWTTTRDFSSESIRNIFSLFSPVI